MWSRLLVSLLVGGSLVGGAVAFLGTSLNVTDPDVAHILCSDAASHQYKDHEGITREAIRRNIREVFLTYPPSSNPDLSLPSDASLSQLFHLYYGANASPTRFLKAVNSITTANINSDSSYQLRYDPALHTDGEKLDAMQKKLTTRYPQILSSILIQEAYSSARFLLGSSLHSIQDFYSHSTWVEQGNTNILTGLGLPGYDLENLAGPAEDVCTPCPFPQGTCTSNVKDGAGLSSGYYTYRTEMGKDYLMPKPTTEGKCSHGGSQDSSSKDPAQGGINKDTAYPCFSPHHYLHKEAAKLAVQATQHYLDQILTVVGFDKYRRLFDLYLGSALSISIDTTGSMGNDISAVKAQVEEIVASSSPELYILSQFNDPSCGPVLKTTDGEEFLKAVSALNAFGGGDHPELFWCGLQLALRETPDYGDVFCFTDAKAKDGEKMDGLISQAQRQNNKVTVILSDLLKRKKKEVRHGRKSKRSTKQWITTVEDYERLTDATGGLLISAAKFDVNDIVAIMGSVVETSTVTILQKEVTGITTTTFPVDDTLVDFQLRLSGKINAAELTDGVGRRYNLLHTRVLQAAGVKVVTFTSHFKALRWTEPLKGEWKLDVDVAPTHHVTITVLATSSLDFLSTFAVLDATPPHPHYRHTEGQPLKDTVYYLKMTLVGLRESNVAIVSGAQFIDKAGLVLRDINYPPPVREEAYLWTTPLPDQPFFVRVFGYLSSGKQWTRQMVMEVWPVQTLVELFSTTEELEAPPGGDGSTHFHVTNYGLESYFTITGTDDLNFLDGLKPDRVFLATNQTTLVKARFKVPRRATHGQVSTVLVTARSETQQMSYNTALTHFFVLPAEIDNQPPTCVLDYMPSCEGFTNNGLCSSRTWDVTATLHDRGSGLYTVLSVPAGHPASTVSDYTPGTNEKVFMTYRSDCCTTQVKIRGTDGQGNVGHCDKIDMGPVGGIIYYFEVEASGHTWLKVRWNITKSSIPVSHYDLVVDGGISHEIVCNNDSCVYYLTSLKPCMVHKLSVTPVFNYMSAKLRGLGKNTQSTITEPEPPVNGRTVDATETSITFTWKPSDQACNSQYKVCTNDVTIELDSASCVVTSNNTLTVPGLQKCHTYISNVTALSSDLITSSPISIYSLTICNILAK